MQILLPERCATTEPPYSRRGPMLFGANNEKGLMLDGLKLKVVKPG